jgi:large subunit ribosomal protein L17
MRHRKHNHLLGVKTAHRISLLANLSCSLIENGRIKTTLAKARALRPTIEKVITLAKKAHVATDAAQKVHYRRLAIARLRNKKAVKKLFDELVEQFVNRNGGYTRIYKLAMPRLGDAADMAIIEFVEDAPKKKTKKKKASNKKPVEETKKTPDPEQSVSEETESDGEVPEETSNETVADVASEATDSGDATDAEEPGDDATESEAEAKEDSEPESQTDVAEDDAEADTGEAVEEEAEETESEAEAKEDSEPESKEDSDSKDEETTSKD